MTPIVVAVSQNIDDVDPARVWAFVADPSNLDRWAPVRSAGFLGTEMPEPGQTVFLHRSRGDRSDDAWRLRIENWEAGHRIECSVDTPGPAHDQRLNVIVEALSIGANPASQLQLAYRGEVPTVLAPLYRWRVQSLTRRALRAVATAVAP